MIRNLKVLLAAALALAAVGLVSGSAAQAAEFHCKTTNCRYTVLPDGTGTTAHQVFIVETADTKNQASFTCNEVKGEGTVATETATTADIDKIVYPSAGCKVNGSSGVTVDMNGCRYRFSTAGTVSVVGCTNAAKAIEITITGGCVYSIPESIVQNKAGIDYHTIGVAPNREITVEVRHVEFVGITANASCAAFTGAGNTSGLVGTYTTGNAIVTGETQLGAMVDLSFA